MNRTQSKLSARTFSRQLVVDLPKDLYWIEIETVSDPLHERNAGFPSSNSMQRLKHACQPHGVGRKVTANGKAYNRGVPINQEFLQSVEQRGETLRNDPLSLKHRPVVKAPINCVAKLSSFSMPCPGLGSFKFTSRGFSDILSGQCGYAALGIYTYSTYQHGLGSLRNEYVSTEKICMLNIIKMSDLPRNTR